MAHVIKALKEITYESLKIVNPWNTIKYNIYVN